MRGETAEACEPAGGAASRGLDEDAVVQSALDCFRKALKAADPVEASAWIRAGHWFERLMPMNDTTAAAQPAPDPGERRTWARTGLTDGALLTAGTTIHITHLRDLSPGGAGVTLPASLQAEVGDVLQLTAPSQGLNRAARVVAVADGLLHLGFMHPMTPVEQLRAGLKVTPAAE